MSSIADNNSQDASIDAYNGKVLLAAVICLSIVIFFVLLLHGYARWVLRRRPIVIANVNVVTEPLHRRSSSTYPGYTTEVALPPGNGLDAKLVASLPKFVYRSREHENGLHYCVVCLSVMVEDEIGRLLPRCKHTFHVECIDMWLTSHSTCPICRAPVKLLTDGTASVGDGGAPLVVLVEPGSANEELSDLSGTSVEGEVVVEMPIIGSDESSNSSSSSSSSPASTSSSSSSSSSSVGCSLKRMLSRSRSESRVFPSLPVN